MQQIVLYDLPMILFRDVVLQQVKHSVASPMVENTVKQMTIEETYGILVVVQLLLVILRLVVVSLQDEQLCV
jgi:hypothetical protein